MIRIPPKLESNTSHLRIQLVLLILAGCIMMAAADMLLNNYAWKSISKIILFTGIPFLFFRINDLDNPPHLRRPSKEQLLFSSVLAVLVVFLILGAYFVIGPYFDFSLVVGALDANVGVNRDNFLYVSLYISFINSFLEESFFRGFAYLTVKQYASHRFAMIFSAVVFALYHVAILTGWFSFPLFLLLIISLVVAGLLFNAIAERAETFIASWFVHMFANVAINLIGFMLFGLL